MNFYIEFENTHDRIPFKAESNSDILDHYVTNLNEMSSNRFSFIKTLVDPNTLLDHIKEANQYLAELGCKLFPLTDNYYDQDYYNEIHYLWVDRQLNENVNAKDAGLLRFYSDNNLFPALIDVLYKLEKIDHYSKVNTLIHKIEDQYNSLQGVTDKWVDIPNIFPKDCCDTHVMNFNIGFNHLGRTLFNKWNTWDTNYMCPDENTFISFHGAVGISLARPYKVPLPQEYVDWCKKMGFTPSGDRVSIGNIPELENKLTEYRIILYNNRNNHFTIKLGDIDGKTV